MSAAPPALAADLVTGLRRLKLAKVRAMAPEVLQTAKVQRWSPEELLRTLVEAEIAARDESKSRARLKAAGFPVHKTLDEFKVTQSSVPQTTFDYVASLEWIRATENLCLVGPAGTGKSHLLIAIGPRSGGRRVAGALLRGGRPGGGPVSRPRRQLRGQAHRRHAAQRSDPG